MTLREKGWLLPPAAICLTLGVLLGRAADSVLWGAGACLLSLPALFLMRSGRRWIAFWVLSLSVGVLSGYLSFHPSLPPEGEYLVRGMITDEIRSGNFDRKSTRLSHVTLDGKAMPGGLYWSWYPDESLPDPLPGDYVTFTAELYHPEGASNPDGYNFREELLRRGMQAAVHGSKNLQSESAPFFSLPGAAARWRYEISCRLITSLGDETGRYAAGMLFGARSLIPSEDRAAFARLGIAHLLSVSGFHVVVLFSLLSFVLQRLSVGRKGIFCVTAFVLGLYCLLCGMNQPVLRASLLLLLAQYGRIRLRPVSPLHLLSAAYLLLVLLSPVQITGVSFQLTFGAMLGIMLISRYLTDLYHPSSPLLRRIWEAFSISLGVQAGILLPQLSVYQQFPLLTFLINPPSVLIGSALIISFWLVLCLLPVPGLVSLLAAPLSAVSGFLLEIVRKLAALPGISLWTPASNWLTVLGVLGVFVALFPVARFRSSFRIFSLLAGLALVIGSLLPTCHSDTEYIQFSAGNADAAILWDQDRIYVYDAGEADGIVSGFLRRRRLTPDAVILSHLHSDHAGGLQSLLDDGIPVPVLYLPEGAEEQVIHENMLALLDKLRRQGTEIRTLKRGDMLSFPSGTLTVLWPEAGRIRPAQDANNYSLVSLLNMKGTTILESADLPGAYDTYAAEPARILKAPHHGSPTSSTSDFLRQVDPEVILLTCRREQRADDYQQALSGAGIVPRLFATARSGAVFIRFTDSGFEATPFLPDRGRQGSIDSDGGITP